MLYCTDTDWVWGSHNPEGTKTLYEAQALGTQQQQPVQQLVLIVGEVPAPSAHLRN